MDTLTRMRSFVDVVRAGGYSAAARVTGRSKAVLSKDVRELEDFLGARLLSRTTRSVAPTEAGLTYFDAAVELLSRIDDLQERMRERSDEPRGLLRVSAPRTYSEGMVGDAIMAFADAYPHVQLDLVFEDRFVDLIAERFDVAIRISELADSSLIARKLAPFRIVVAATPDAIRRFGRPSTPDDLANLPCIVDSNHRVKRAYSFDTPEGRRSVRIHERIAINAPSVIRLAALKGLGYCQVPHLTLQDDLAAGRLETVLEPYELKGVGIYAVFAEKRHMTPKLRVFIDTLAEQFSNQRSGG